MSEDLRHTEQGRPNVHGSQPIPDAQIVAAMKVALAEVLPPLVEEAIRRHAPRYAMGDDLPLDLADVEAILPISLKQLRRMRKSGAFRMLKLPETDKPITTIGAVKALLRKGELE